MASNILKSLASAKTRTFVILLGVLVIGGTTVAFMQMDSNDTAGGIPSKTVPIPSSVRSIPGNVVPEKYAELQRTENIQRAQEAEQKKGSAIPTIIGQASSADANGSAAAGQAGGLGGAGGDIFGDVTRGGFAGGEFGPGGPFGAGGAGFGAAGVKSEAELREERLREQRDRLERAKAEKERQKEVERLRKLAEKESKEYQKLIQDRSKSMQTYAAAVYKDWSTVVPQAYISGVLAEINKKEIQSGKTKVTISEDGKVTYEQTPEKSASDLNDMPKKVIKAGTVLFGVLDTAINSDEPGPIMATIVHGKYKGGKLLGTVQKPENGEKVILSFQTLSLPKLDSSIGVNVVAIDPDTARTALASDVDHHYLLRYGSLFASAFMEGYGKAITEAGSVTTDKSDGSSTSTRAELSGSEEIYAAFGKVGEEWGKAVRPLFDKPVTITVDQGLGLGLLFLADTDVTPQKG